MTNLQRLLTNPDSQNGIQAALVTAVLLDEQLLAPLVPLTPSVKSTAVSYVATPADSTIFFSGVMDGTQGITLPTTGLTPGKVISVKVTSADATAGPLNINTGNAAEYAGNPQLYSIPGGAKVGGSVTLEWDGSAWWLLVYNQ